MRAYLHCHATRNNDNRPSQATANMNRAGDSADGDDHRPVHKPTDEPTPHQNVNVKAEGKIPNVNPASAHVLSLPPKCREVTLL